MNKFILFWSFLFVLLNYNVKCVSNVYIDTVVVPVLNSLKEVKPYQVAIILEDHTKFPKIVDSIMKHISNRRISIVLNPRSPKDYKKYISRPQPLLENPRHTTLFLSIFQASGRKKDTIKQLLLRLKTDLKFITSLSSRLRAPYLLVVLSHSKIPDRIIEIVLRNAWTEKFLNAAVFQIANDSCLNSFTFNPFFDEFTINCYSPKIRVFPNKLKDLNGYPLRFSLIRRPPAVNYDLDSEGNPININGSDYADLVIFSRTMNFSMKMITPNITSYAEFINHGKNSLLDLIANGNIDFGGNEIYLHHAFKNRYLKLCEQSVGTWYDDFIALAPILPAPGWSVNFSDVSIILDISILVTFLYLLTKIGRFDPRFWQPFYIVQTLLGNPSPRPPVNLVERLVFVFFVVWSQKYSANLYAKMTRKNLRDIDSGQFGTLEDLADADDVVLLTHRNYFNITFFNGDSVLRRLEKKVESINEVMDCPDKVLKNNNVVCLLDKSVALTKIQKSRSRGESRMKIVKPNLWSAPKGLVFSEASPFVPQFDRMIQRIVEGGIWQKWIVYDKTTKRVSLDFEGKISDRLLKRILTVVWMCGFAMACAAFVSEFIIYSYKRRRRSKKKLLKK